MIKIIEQGIAECIKEPRGVGGLEGYDNGESYKFELCRRRENAPYYRIYPNDELADYYETCGKYQFSQHFRVLQK